MWGAHGWDRVLGCAPLYIPQTSTPPWAWLCLSFPPATGTTRAFPAVLFGARRFRIPRGTKGPRYPHHPHTSTPRARMLPWGLIPHHWDPPHPVPRPGMPQQHFGVSPSRVPPPQCPPSHTAGAGSPGTAPWSPRPAGQSRLCRIRDPPAPPCRARRHPLPPWAALAVSCAANDPPSPPRRRRGTGNTRSVIVIVTSSGAGDSPICGRPPQGLTLTITGVVGRVG